MIGVSVTNLLESGRQRFPGARLEIVAAEGLPQLLVKYQGAAYRLMLGETGQFYLNLGVTRPDWFVHSETGLATVDQQARQALLIEARAAFVGAADVWLSFEGHLALVLVTDHQDRRYSLRPGNTPRVYDLVNLCTGRPVNGPVIRQLSDIEPAVERVIADIADSEADKLQGRIDAAVSARNAAVAAEGYEEAAVQRDVIATLTTTQNGLSHALRQQFVGHVSS